MSDQNTIDLEAEVFGRCVEELSRLTAEATGQMVGLTAMLYGRNERVVLPNLPAIKRVLLYLSLRFGADLIEKPKPPPPLLPAHSCNCDLCEEGQ